MVSSSSKLATAPARRRRSIGSALLALAALAAGNSALASGADAARGPAALVTPSARDTLVVDAGSLPPDFAIALEGGEGRAIPGEYAFLHVRVDRAGRGTFRFESSVPSAHPVEGTFQVPEATVRQLHRATLRLWNPRPAGPASNPGSVQSADLVLAGYGTRVRVSEALRAPFDEDARVLSRLLRRAVPDSLWARARHTLR